MLRDELGVSLKTAMKEKNTVAVSTVRLILTAIKDRDIAARTDGKDDGISDQEILKVLQTMVKQRRESIDLYEKGGRAELAEREREEITIIEDFLPRQLGDEEINAAVGGVIDETGAATIKDMGKAMSVLRERYAGQMDFGKASAVLKERLNAG